jgi:hypothetical protein
MRFRGNWFQPVIAATAEANDCIVVRDNERHFPGISVKASPRAIADASLIAALPTARVVPRQNSAQQSPIPRSSFQEPRLIATTIRKP